MTSATIDLGPIFGPITSETTFTLHKEKGGGTPNSSDYPLGIIMITGRF